MTPDSSVHLPIFLRLSRHTVLTLALILAVAATVATPAAASESAPHPAAANFEMRYLSETIDHHFLAVQMVQTCVHKAIHPELRALCQRIASDQANEVTQMQGWLTDWYLSEGVHRQNIDAEPELPPGGEQMLRQLQHVSGGEFEVMFMQMMIQHHEMAVREAGHCLRQAYHAELRGLCGHIIGEQSAEIAQMRVWLCVWYDICQGGRPMPR